MLTGHLWPHDEIIRSMNSADPALLNLLVHRLVFCVLSCLAVREVAGSADAEPCGPKVLRIYREGKEMILLREIVDLAESRGVALEEGPPLLGLLAVVDSIAEDGYVVVLKWDGERNPAEGDGPRHTVLITGSPMNGDFIRRDEATMQSSLEGALFELATR